MSATSPAPLLRVENLTKHFPIRTGILQRVTGAVKAVEQVSFDVGRGETLALVGESGCGKTTTGRALLRLIEPTAGSVHFGGTDVLQLRGEALRQMRRRQVFSSARKRGALLPTRQQQQMLAYPAQQLLERRAQRRARLQQRVVAHSVDGWHARHKAVGRRLE